MVDITNLILMLPYAIGLFLLNCLINKVNVKRIDRAKQFFFPLLAFLYVIAIMLYSKNIKEIININDGSLFDVFEFNLFVLTIYISIKSIIKKLTDKLLNPSNILIKLASSWCYEFDVDRNIWLLKNEYVQTRNFFKISHYTCMVISFVLMAISSQMVQEGSIKTALYPAYVIIVIGELFYFLNGLTSKEYELTAIGMQDNASRVANYSLMRKFLNQLFGDKNLNEGTDVNIDISSPITNEELISRYENSNNQDEVALARFFKNKIKHGLQLDQNYLKSSIELLNHKSILFNNPFYNDLSPYMFYPMHQQLLKHNKVLVILGRHGIENDIEEWIKTGISSITNMSFFWNVGVLNNEEFVGDIGIIRRSDITNIQLIQNNQLFLNEVGYVVIIEPSKLITTAQVGLNVIIKKCREYDYAKKVVYCMIDKNCDGLLDAMSHIVLCSISEVSATNKHTGTVSHMCWETDGEYLHHRILPNITRYLGLGTELSFVALKNQIPKTKWYGGEAFPVVDQKWIVKQYYHELSKYAGVSSNQGEIDKIFNVYSGFWNAPIEENSYITVEDETNNLFEILRDFSTRSKSQGFVNVISSNYLLREYMIANSKMFLTDAKSIPNFVADFSKTNRNVVLSMILKMSNYPVPEQELEEEMSLIGIKTFDLKKQFWHELYKCFNSASNSNLPTEYKEAVQYTVDKKINKNNIDFDIDVLESFEDYDYIKGELVKSIKISNKDFIDAFVNDLKSASYVAEDEFEKENYLGSELVSHVYQKYLPGQFLSLCGKYYEMRTVSANNEIVVRRASDHINNRKEYRQIRNYHFYNFAKTLKTNEYKNTDKVLVASEYADFKVDTYGYYESYRYDDLKNSTRVYFDNKEAPIPSRQYINKRILKIQFSLDNESEKILYTIALLINEVFRTMFAQDQGYIVALTYFNNSDEINPLTYMIEDTDECIDKKCIYIVEDSQIDIGLLETVERNIDRIFEIICDYLDWYLKRTCELTQQDDNQYEDFVISHADTAQIKKESTDKSLLLRIKDWMMSIFAKKENKVKETEKEINYDDASLKKQLLKEKNISDFLMYGYDHRYEKLDLEGTLNYLENFGYSDSSLKQARVNRELSDLYKKQFVPNKTNTKYCDFCGAEITGVEFDVMFDGRCRCINCSKTVVKSISEYQDILNEVKRNVETLYEIRFETALKVEVMNRYSIQKKSKKSLVPSSGVAETRIQSLVRKTKGGYTIYIENGATRFQTMLHFVYQLIHIWEHMNWSANNIRKKYANLEEEIYDGMAKWACIQYAYLIGEEEKAKNEEILLYFEKSKRTKGFLRFKANYPLINGAVMGENSPFNNKDMPLSFDYCGKITEEQINNECMKICNIPFDKIVDSASDDETAENNNENVNDDFIEDNQPVHDSSDNPIEDETNDEKHNR